MRCLRGIREFEMWDVCDVSESWKCEVFSRYKGV